MWKLLEFDFTEQLHLCLEDEIRVRSWRWLAVHVGGLLSKRGPIDLRGHRYPVSLIGWHFFQAPSELTETESDDG